jgi:hypothetical protein
MINLKNKSYNRFLNNTNWRLLVNKTKKLLSILMIALIITIFSGCNNSFLSNDSSNEELSSIIETEEISPNSYGDDTELNMTFKIYDTYELSTLDSWVEDPRGYNVEDIFQCGTAGQFYCNVYEFPDYSFNEEILSMSSNFDLITEGEIEINGCKAFQYIYEKENSEIYGVSYPYVQGVYTIIDTENGIIEIDSFYVSNTKINTDEYLDILSDINSSFKVI